MLKIQQTELFMKKYFDILRKCLLFREIADEDLTPMLGCLGAKTADYAKDETIIAEGGRASHIGIVLSGGVQIVRIDYIGNRSIVADIRPGGLFGESFACADVESIPVNVIASADSRILLIDCMRITHICSNSCGFHRQVIYNLLRVVATKNLMFHQKIEVTSKRTTREKLMAYLLLQAKKYGSNAFTIPYDRQQLADYLEVERSGLSAEISKMRSEGILESKRSYFKLL